MVINAQKRHSVIHNLLPEQSEHILDIGCGVITPFYPYVNKARRFTCVDWKLKKITPIPENIECIEGDFTQMNLQLNYYDIIILADVLEHILLEQESLFIKKCISVLKPGGYLIVSVPHQGTFAWLDPYQVKPAIHRFFWKLGFYKHLHNGFCDIRKGHQHYTSEEITEKFKPLKLLKVIYWGYVFDPLLS